MKHSTIRGNAAPMLQTSTGRDTRACMPLHPNSTTPGETFLSKKLAYSAHDAARGGDGLSVALGGCGGWYSALPD